MTDAGAIADAGAGGVPATRLVPWQLETNGTQPLVRGIYDTQEQLRCSFVLDSTGQLRCLPFDFPSLIFAGYADAACTREAMLVEPTLSQTPSSGLVTRVSMPGNGCAPERSEIQTVTVLPEGTHVYAPGIDGKCAEQQEPPAYDDGSPARVALRGEAVVPPDHYVAANLVDGPLLSPQLKLVRAVTDDGAAFDHQLIDQHWNHACELSDHGSCAVPHLGYDTSFFADASCTTPVWRLRLCNPKTFIAGPSGVDEGDHAIGDAFTGVVFENLKGCHISSPSPDHWYVEGPALLASEATSLVTWRNLGTGRLRLRAVQGDATYVLADYLAAGARYHDTVTNEDCSPVDAPDGRVYCVAANAVEVSINPQHGYFADAQCTKPAFQCLSPGCDDGLGILVTTRADGTKRASSLVRIASQTEVYLKGAEDSCSATPGMYFFGVDSDVPWEQFPTLAERAAR